MSREEYFEDMTWQENAEYVREELRAYYEPWPTAGADVRSVPLGLLVDAATVIKEAEAEIARVKRIYGS